MTCHRIRDNWHSYVKNSMNDEEFSEMTNHLANCPECLNTVSVIRNTLASFAQNQAVLLPPVSIKIKVMENINKHKYKKAVVPQSFELKNWGFSMIASGLILFVLNLSPAIPSFLSHQVTDLNLKIGRQITLPLEKMGLATHAVLEGIETLNINAILIIKT